MTSPARIRLKGYLRTFSYMTSCGLLFMIGGGGFFIYESVKLTNQNKPSFQTNQSHPTTIHLASRQQQANPQIPRHGSDPTSFYVKELRCLGFIFLGVGFLLFAIGAPLTYQFWKRYRRSKEAERNPIVVMRAPAMYPPSCRNETSSNNLELVQTDQDAIQQENGFIGINEETEASSLNPHDQIAPGDSSLFYKMFGIDNVAMDVDEGKNI